MPPVLAATGRHRCCSEPGGRLGRGGRRQVSRYENGKVAPGLEAVIRIAETFNVSVDYLVIESVPRRPLHAPSSPIDARLADLDGLTDDERATIANVIDAITTKAKLRLITGGAS